MEQDFLTRKIPGKVIPFKNISYSTQLILSKAKELGIDAEEIEGTGIFRLRYRDQVRYFIRQIPDTVSFIGGYATGYKHVTKHLLDAAGVSTPKGYLVLQSDSEKLLKEIFHDLQKPIVVKPNNATHGIGVSVNISSYQEYETTLKRLFSDSTLSKNGAIVEEMVRGKEYRILVTRKGVVGVVFRNPANVVGDGASTINELIDKKNEDPKRGDNDEKIYPLTIIRVDEALKNYLASQNLSLRDVLPKGERIFLRDVANISMGGDPVDVTDIIHSSVKKIAMNVLEAIPGSAFIGIDMMTQDITANQEPTQYSILEVNHSPGLSYVHELPFEAQRRESSRAFLEELFGEIS